MGDPGMPNSLWRGGEWHWRWTTKVKGYENLLHSDCYNFLKKQILYQTLSCIKWILRRYATQAFCARSLREGSEIRRETRSPVMDFIFLRYVNSGNEMKIKAITNQILTLIPLDVGLCFLKRHISSLNFLDHFTFRRQKEEKRVTSILIPSPVSTPFWHKTQ